VINTSHYQITNAHVPICLLEDSLQCQFRSSSATITSEGLVVCNLEVKDGKIITINQDFDVSVDIPVWDADHGIVLPCFVDLHTHLDKGHSWERTPNPTGTFAAALTAVERDRVYWQYQDLYKRMEFGLKCSYAHGTKALRTHLDCPIDQYEISLQVFADLQTQWRDRLTLQVVPLILVEQFAGQQGEILSDRIAAMGGTLGGVALINPDLDSQLDRIFSLAKARNLDLDFHADENDDPDSTALLKIAEAALRNDFSGQVNCGHCCSLAIQDQQQVAKTLQLVQAAGISVVSLPMCNLYLQDRQPHRTPRWRGVTLLHELKAQGIAVAIASDNVRDPFYGFGDHDGLEVFQMAVRIAHLDTPYADWIRAITTTPAQLMGLGLDHCQLGAGAAADFILFKGIYFSEILSRSQSDRLVIRNGRAIDTTLPDYRELN